MSYFNIVCDSCGRGVQGITWVNGMKFCAKCYQETFGASKDWQLLDKDKTIAEQQQRIAELEEQLKDCINPKFKIGQEVWFVNETLEVMHNGKINAFEVYKFKDRPYEFWYDIDYIEDNTEFSDEVSDEFMFATREEALAKLQELTAKNV